MLGVFGAIVLFGLVAIIVAMIIIIKQINDLLNR